MNPIYKNLFIIGTGLVLCRQAVAQAAPGTVYKATFRGMSWDSVISDLNIANGASIVHMNLLPNGRSGFYDYQGTDPMLFFREITGTDGKPAAQIAGSIPLSEFKPRTLLIFFSKPSVPVQYNVAAVDDSDAAIPPGCYYFMNLSKTPLQAKVGASQGNVPANGSLTLHGNPSDGGGLTGMEVDAVKPDGGIQPAYSNMLPFNKTTRTLVFVYQTPETGQFVVKRIAEDATMIPRPTPARTH
jgi:hypothetical protein